MVRSTEELTDKLARERIWRLKEISAIKTRGLSASTSPLDRSIMFRAGCVLFYAHWEGYVKTSSTLFLKYISLQRIPLSNMADFLASIYIRQTLGGQPSEDEISKFCKFALFSETFCPRIKYKLAIDLESNLSSKVLKKLCAQIGIDYVAFETRSVFIDEILLRNRNRVAHGEHGNIDSDTFENLSEQVTDLISIFHNQIDNSVASSAYRKQVA
ncbi:MAE_28990/MAE_18760 family HEPN-like nuclease [Oceanicaulis sp. UBA2681]|uniref:MAE_28990/MAE_18760 family HEPN-like nuclease n=1 Tax=Oceanicaulis sp. UBA2681 TaxID=1947007 RepID=UPI0039C8EE76